MPKCQCSICQHMLDFELPPGLLKELESENVVLFAGAGISTESRQVLNYTFYDFVAAELGRAEQQLSFPDLMQELCDKPNGRLRLLELIRGRFRHIHSFPELEASATRFHRAIATFSPLHTIVTTNWDTYFEDYCDAIPFVTDNDLAFWDSDQRRVLKIHGSINSYGSIVATDTDYVECLQRLNSGLIGSILKTMLATKTVVFAGYSLNDYDFQNIFAFVKQQMQGLHRTAYVVNPFKSECERLEAEGIISIQTDATYFFEQIKAHFVDSGRMYSDRIYAEAELQRANVEEEHAKMHTELDAQNFPQIVYAAAYQDGLMHGFDRVLALSNSGEYSRAYNYHNVWPRYKELQTKKRKAGIYEDVAYIEGYVNAFIYLAISQNSEESQDVEPLPHPPMYYVFGAPPALSARGEIFDFQEFKSLAPDMDCLHKAAAKRAKKITESLVDGVQFHHPPWL